MTLKEQDDVEVKYLYRSIMIEVWRAATQRTNVMKSSWVRLHQNLLSNNIGIQYKKTVQNKKNVCKTLSRRCVNVLLIEVYLFIIDKQCSLKKSIKHPRQNMSQSTISKRYIHKNDIVD